MSGGGRYTQVKFYCHVCNLKEVEANKGILGLHNLVAEMIVTFDEKGVPIRYTLLTNPLQCVSMKKANIDNCSDFQIFMMGQPHSDLVKKSRSLKYPPELFNLVSQLNPFPPYTIDGYDRKIAFKKLLECLITEKQRPTISGVAIPEDKATHDYPAEYEEIMNKNPIQSVSIEKGWALSLSGKVFKLSCYDNKSKSYKSTVSFTGENPFSIQFDNTTPSYSIPLVQSSSPPSSPPEVVTGESATTVVQSDFENKDNEIDYGFYISRSSSSDSGRENEDDGNAGDDYKKLIMYICSYKGPLQIELDIAGGYQTTRGKKKLEQFARKLPTKNEEKLMAWNRQTYEQELERVKELFKSRETL